MKSLANVTAIIILVVLLGNVTSANTIGYWRFEEGTAGGTAFGAGSILDNSAFGNHGTPVGDPAYTSSVAVATIPRTGAGNLLSLDFDGNGDAVLIPTDAALDSADPFTVEFWVNSSDATSGQKLLVDKSHGFGDTLGWFFQTDGIGRVAFGLGSAGSFRGVGTTDNIFDGQWHHVAGTYDGNTIELFVDGVSQDTETVGVFTNNDRDIRIGSARNNGRFFTGQIDELRISNRVLSSSEFLSVPEPTSLGMLALFGGLLGLKRHRR